MSFKITDNDLKNLVEKQIISEEQSKKIKDYLVNNIGSKKLSSFTVLSYFGALLIISSMTWFATKAFSDSQPLILLATSLSYFFIFFIVGNFLLKKVKSYIPGMLLLTVCIFMIPLIIYSIQKYFGMWMFDFPGSYQDFYNWIKKGWFFMEIGTIIISIIFIMIYKFEFFTFPLSFALWFFSLDLVPILFGIDFDWEQRRIVTLVFGLIILFVSYIIDIINKKKDYSFWLYLFGLLAFWSSISISYSSSITDKILYGCLNFLLILISILFKRSTFLIFGSIGIILFLGDLTYNVFENSFWFPIILSVVGVIIFMLALILLKNKSSIDKFIDTKIPRKLKCFIPRKDS